MDDFAYVIETFASTIAADVRLNDWPAFHALDGVGRVARQKVNPWLLEGANRFEVRVQPLADDAAEALVEAKRAKGEEVLPAICDVVLYKTEHGTRTKEEDILFSFRWSESECPLQADAMTTVFDHTITFAKAFGSWRWESARRYMPADRQDVENLVAAFHNGLERRDTPALVNMLRLKLEEMARSFSQDPSDMLVKQQKYFDELYFKEPSWKVDQLDTSKLVMESSAGGRLLKVSGPANEAPLTGSAGSRPFDFDLTVSHVDGSWLIVR